MPENKILTQFAYMESFYEMKKNRKCINNTKQKTGEMGIKLSGAKNRENAPRFFWI